MTEMERTIKHIRLMRAGEKISAERIEKIAEADRTDEQKEDLKIYTAEIEAFEKAVTYLEAWGKLLSFLNDYRFLVAPDESTPEHERKTRETTVETIDAVTEEIEKLLNIAEE